jgi:hypothetical protein
MLFKETITVYSDNHTITINALYKQSSEPLNVKTGGRLVETDVSELRSLQVYCSSPGYCDVDHKTGGTWGLKV